MKKSVLTIALGLSFATLAGYATSDEAGHPAVKARDSIMHLYAHSLGQLGAMAKGNVDYNAEAAAKAAGNLATLVQLDQSTMWPQGTDNASISGTRALPAIWQNFPDVMAKGKALSDAVAVMKDAAGTDLAALQAAMSPLGAACGGCHKVYRAPEE